MEEVNEIMTEVEIEISSMWGNMTPMIPSSITYLTWNYTESLYIQYAWELMNFEVNCAAPDVSSE